MKKITLSAIIMAFILVSATICIAQAEQEQTGQMGHMMSGHSIMGHHEMSGNETEGENNMKTRCPMGMRMGGMKGMSKGCMMGGCMMGKTMVPSDDGGVIVMIGNKLYKYDKNLELKKETELSIDYESMKKMMMEMHHTDMTGGMHESGENDGTNK